MFTARLDKEVEIQIESDGLVLNLPKDCEFCKCKTEACPAERDGYSCTRDVGHEGPHVACGFNSHQLYTW